MTLLGTAPHCLNRPQTWDLLANEMGYLWDAEHLVLCSFREIIGMSYNKDYYDAKDHLSWALSAKASVLSLREEFLEAEGDLDVMITFYLEKKQGGGGNLAGSLRRGRKWRRRARALSGEGAGPRAIAEFQCGLVKTLNWGVFGSFEQKESTLLFLEDRLAKLG